MSSHNIDGATSPSITVNSCDAIITIGNKIVPSVKIHLTAVFSILNTFVRRSERNSRVIGALLGTSKDGIVEVSLHYKIFHHHHLFVVIFSNENLTYEPRKPQKRYSMHMESRTKRKRRKTA